MLFRNNIYLCAEQNPNNILKEIVYLVFYKFRISIKYEKNIFNWDNDIICSFWFRSKRSDC